MRASSPFSHKGDQSCAAQPSGLALRCCPQVERHAPQRAHRAEAFGDVGELEEKKFFVIALDHSSSCLEMGRYSGQNNGSRWLSTSRKRPTRSSHRAADQAETLTPGALRTPQGAKAGCCGGYIRA